MASESTPSPTPPGEGACRERHPLPVTGAASKKRKQNKTTHGVERCLRSPASAPSLAGFLSPCGCDPCFGTGTEPRTSPIPHGDPPKAVEDRQEFGNTLKISGKFVKWLNCLNEVTGVLSGGALLYFIFSLLLS